MKILLTCFLLFNLIVSHAKEIKWNEGSLVLQTREVLTGKFAIDPYHDLILHQQADNRVNIYNAHQVHALYFYDVDENINRKFVSINQPVLSFKKYHLYEMVVFGEMTVVRKIKALAVDSDARDYDYFVKQDASLIPLREFRDKVYPELTYKL